MATKEAEPQKKSFSENDLGEKEKKDFLYVKKRIDEMQAFRRRAHYGVVLDDLWAQADRAYIPHRIKTKGTRIIAEDETKGWRGATVTLGSSEWQSDIAQANPFIKISVALAILVDQNPSGVFTATVKKFQSATLLMKQLYERSWAYARSKGQLKLFVHNLAKYGWATGRTYPLRIARTVNVLSHYNPDEPEKSVYEEKEVVEFNDIMRENLDPRNVWIDDMGRPNNQFSIRDWTWRKVYTMDAAKEEFGKYPFFDTYVMAGGITDEVVTGARRENNEKTETDLVEIYFYENRLKDLFTVIINGVPVVMSPLPISDNHGVKKLSLWQTFWNIRHAQSPYGIGIFEAIRYDQAFLDRIRNMTIDQLTMSIYKMFFYQGTQALTDTGDIKIAPGVGKQVLNPKDITWLEIPGPGADAYRGLEFFQKSVDDASGITEPLTGEITGKTAFELAQAKESAIKRLKVPLDNILEALNDEGYISVYLIQLMYSIPEVYEISDPRLIDDYLREIQSDEELFERGETETKELDEFGQPVMKPTFTAKVFPEFPLNLDKDEKGNLIETKDSQFFRIKPSGLKWEGIITIKSQSILSPSKQIDKALDLEMYNILIPLFSQPPELYMKTAESICKLYDKDPRDVLPETWLQGQDPQDQPLFTDSASVAQPPEEAITTPPSTGPTPTMPSDPKGIVGKVMSRLTAPFRGA